MNGLHNVGSLLSLSELNIVEHVRKGMENMNEGLLVFPEILMALRDGFKVATIPF